MEVQGGTLCFYPPPVGVIVGSPRLLHARVLVCWFRLFRLSRGDKCWGIGVHLAHWERGVIHIGGYRKLWESFLTLNISVQSWLKRFVVILVGMLVARGQSTRPAV